MNTNLNPMPVLTKHQIGLLKMVIAERENKLTMDISDADVFAYIKDRAEDTECSRVHVMEELMDTGWMIGEGSHADHTLRNFV